MVKSFNLAPIGLKRTLSKLLLVGVASSSALLSGVVPAIQTHPSDHSQFLIFSNAAYAQDITQTELVSYVRSLLEIEPIRQAAYDEIKRRLGSGQVPPIACHRPETLAALDVSIRPIATNYCNRAIQIVERNGLTITRFNTIMLAIQRDRNLDRQVQNIIAILTQQGLP